MSSKTTFPMVEGRSSGRDSMHSHYGRRIERDGTWTVYHVFTGLPAEIGGRFMLDLEEAEATRTMTWVNAGNVERRRIARRHAGERSPQ